LRSFGERQDSAIMRLDELAFRRLQMKSQNMFVLFTALLAVAMGHASADEKSLKTKKTADEVQASVDNPDTHKGSVTGTVIDEKGKAVEEAKVELTDLVTKEPPSSVMTDKKGQYAFSGLLPGTYRVQAKKEGTQSDTKDIKVTNGQNAGPKLILHAKGT
jgi:protocatechuate 3,4-dioxygenase beta subunit